MEAIAEATSARTLGQLENYFSSYGDLPREIILKHDYFASATGSPTLRSNWLPKRW